MNTHPEPLYVFVVTAMVEDSPMVMGVYLTEEAAIEDRIRLETHGYMGEVVTETDMIRTVAIDVARFPTSRNQPE